MGSHDPAGSTSTLRAVVTAATDPLLSSASPAVPAAAVATAPEAAKAVIPVRCCRCGSRLVRRGVRSAARRCGRSPRIAGSGTVVRTTIDGSTRRPDRAGLWHQAPRSSDPDRPRPICSRRGGASGRPCCFRRTRTTWSDERMHAVLLPRARAHPASRLARPDRRGSAAHHALVQPADLDRLHAAAPRQRAGV